MKRGAPLRRTRGLMRTGRILTVGRRRARRIDEQAEVRRAVFKRDGGCIVRALGEMRIVSEGVPVPGCFGPPSAHHLLKASQGGAYTEENLVTLCVGHNDWVEDQPRAAYALGLVIRRGDHPADALRRRRTWDLVR